MLDHVGITVPVGKYELLVKFYSAALASIGYKIQIEIPGQATGFGPLPYKVPFWVACEQPGQNQSAGIATGELASEGEAPKGNGLHLAFSARNHDEVKKFHEAALMAGAKDNGKPEIKTMYHPKYFGAFVIDPLGNNLEVVDHGQHSKDAPDNE